MKKIFCTLLAIAFIFLLAGCGGNENTKPNTTQVNNSDSTTSVPSNNTVNEPSIIDESVLKSYSTASESDFLVKEFEGGVSISEYKGASSIVVIPEVIEGKTVTGIDSYVFANESKVRAVLIPKTVKSLESTFSNSANIELVICEGVEDVGYFTFANCAKLSKIVFGEKLTKLGEMSISGCPELTEVNIPSSLTSIDSTYAWSVFYNCPKLVISGDEGSFIESFAADNNLKFSAK